MFMPGVPKALVGDLGTTIVQININQNTMPIPLAMKLIDHYHYLLPHRYPHDTNPNLYKLYVA